MIDEPIYEYIKGQGWVPAVTATASVIRQHGGKSYKVTVYARTPKPGERGWDIGCTPNLENIRHVPSEAGWRGDNSPGFGWWVYFFNEGLDHCVTVVTEPL